ncbi:RKM3 [Symbiodinium microadriaticum]|nr:RKM3 [Symbiodinium microadriaticum]
MTAWMLRELLVVCSDSDSICEVLAKIPKSAVLSIRNTAAAKVIEQEGLDLDASLRLAIATEVALGSRSRWHGYFMSFTRPFEDLPYLWSPEQRRQLAGTDAEGTVEETLAELELEYAEVIQPLLPRLPLSGATISRENYLQAATLATSRAFTVDDYHLEALVPLADAFNHRCQKVPAGEVVREIQEGEGAAAPPLKLTGGAAAPFAPWLGPVPPMQIALAESRMVPEGAKPKRQVGRKTGTGRSGQLMIYVLTEIPADTEIFNTYGEFSNDKLLQDYGFVLEQNAFNTVTLARSMLAEDEVRQTNYWSRRCRMLQAPAPGRRFRRQLRFAAQHAAVLGLTQAGEEESEEGSEDAEMGSSQEQGLATFFELDRGPLPKALRVLLAVLSLPTSTLVRARATPPGVLQRFLRRSDNPMKPSYQKEDTDKSPHRRWEAAEPPREKAALALRRFAGTAVRW